MNRQQIRKALVIIMFALLPVTLMYISPIVIIMGASVGIVTGSMILFILTFILSLVLGRFWCGGLCPMGGWQEICSEIQKNPVSGGKKDLIKYGVWVFWIIILVAAFIGAGGIKAVDIFFGTKGGISLSEPMVFLVYYLIFGFIFLLAVFAGKRAFCHYLCPICVDLIIGRKIGSLLRLPALNLSGRRELCINCGKCSKNCPMGLDVQSMVQEEHLQNPDCILCASCSDICPRSAISFELQR